MCGSQSLGAVGEYGNIIYILESQVALENWCVKCDVA